MGYGVWDVWGRWGGGRDAPSLSPTHVQCVHESIYPYGNLCKSNNLKGRLRRKSVLKGRQTHSHTHIYTQPHTHTYGYTNIVHICVWVCVCGKTHLEDLLRRGVLEGRHRPPQRGGDAEEACGVAWRACRWVGSGVPRPSHPLCVYRSIGTCIPITAGRHLF